MAPTEEQALEIAHDQWRSNVFPAEVSYDLASAAHFDAVSTHVTEEQLRRSANVSSDPGQHTQWLGEYLELGFDELYLHFVGQHQQPFIEAFAEKVLPQLRGTGTGARAKPGGPSHASRPFQAGNAEEVRA